MPKTVLVVDDSAEIRRGVRSAFERDNRFHVVGEAVDGLDAIEKAGQLKPDLIVLDFSMPNMNGFEAARTLTRTMPAVLLILFTMHLGSIVESEARNAGFSAVFSKNQDVELLVRQAQSLLDGVSAQA